MKAVMTRALILAAALTLAAPAGAQQAERVWRTPAPAPQGLSACAGKVDCEEDLAGAPPVVRPEKVWAVRSSGLPATEDWAPAAPLAIIVDADAEEDDRRDRRSDPGLRRPRD